MEKYLVTLQETNISLHVALTKILADFKHDHRKTCMEKKHVSKIKHCLTVPRKCARKYIYMVGGFTRPKGGRWSDAKTLSNVERFDTFYHSWHCVPSCQFARSSLGAGVINGQVCVVGGENDSLIFDSVETYDPVTHEWNLLPGMTTPRLVNLSHVTRKPVFRVCDQLRLKQPCSATETTWSCNFDFASIYIILSRLRTTKAPIRLGRCAG